MRMDQEMKGSRPFPLSRRKFLKLGVGAVGALAALEVGSASLMFLQPQTGEGAFSGIVKAGDVDSFPTGTVTEFQNGRFYLVRSYDGGFLAIYRRCPHLGCIVNWEAEEEQFYCPCHASSFDIHGNFENAPVSRALDTFNIKIRDNVVFVDTTHIHRRENFDPEQLSYA
jgi:cytochrome b6-f complex iron-sulfur subunit